MLINVNSRNVTNKKINLIWEIIDSSARAVEIDPSSIHIIHIRKMKPERNEKRVY